MLRDLVKSAADETGLTQARAREALGIIFNAAERQGSDAAEALFRKIPGARTLSARTGSDIGAATGVIARLIEQTPGGRRHVAEGMLRALHGQGLGHAEIGKLFAAIQVYAAEAHGITGFLNLGDFLGGPVEAEADGEAARAVA